MADRFKRQLTSWRVAALLPAAVLALGALLAACAPGEEPRPPVLLNDPPPPIHIGGEPYPPGTIPPHLAPLWEEATDALRQPGAHWGEDGSCDTEITPLGYVHNQWFYVYEEEPEDPMAAISAELRAAGVEYESIIVRTREYYDEHYDADTFFNWLAGGDPAFDQFAALQRLGGELHPSASPGENPFFDPNFVGRHGTAQFGYHVKLKGIRGGDSDKISALPNAREIQLYDPCLVDPVRSGRLLRWLVGGIYTTFGDDLVITVQPAPDPAAAAP